MKIEDDILIVDDEIPSLRLLAELLEKEGYHVRPAEKAQTAIDSALAKPPGLILLDVRMPEMDGFEICRRLKQDERTREVPVIFISALHEVEDKVRGFEAGGVDFITKPFQEEEVLARVRTHTELRNMQLNLEKMIAERSAELAKSEAKYRGLVENALVGVFTSTLDGDFTFVNEAFARMFDFDSKELIQARGSLERWRNLKDRERMLAELQQHGRVTNFEAETITHTGRHIYVLISAKQIGTNIVGMVMDITDRKQAEEKLIVSEERFRRLMEESPLAMEILTPEGQISQVNSSWLRLWGCNEEETAQVMAEYNMLADQQVQELGITPLVEKAFEGKDVVLPPIKYDAAIVAKEVGLEDTKKKALWIQCHLYSIKEANGEIAYVVNTYVDITNVKQVEEGLRQSKDFNKSVLMSMLDNIAVLDREGNILTINDAWMQFARENDAKSMDGVGPGVNYLRICREALDNGDDTVSDALDGISSVLDGSSLYFEMEYPCDSPTVKRWFLMTVSPFKGQKGGVIVTHIDITSIKMAEIELRGAYEEIEQLKNQLEAESAYLQDEIKLEHNFENIIGQSEALKYVLHRVEQVASVDSPVLIMGETGTGKELVARALHKLSPHGKRALVKVNCAALPGELIESELFGREKGAFTGATTTQLGRFELAKGSTLFLDEIGELPLELQGKLLRVLESGAFERLGGPRTLHSDARIIAATNRVLEEEMRKGRFREDLWYRLKVFPITVPPLREHPEDIPLLVKWFVEKLARKMGKRVDEISKQTMQMLQSYPWPGNVRELKHAIEGALITARGKKLNFELPQIADTALSDFKSFEQMERDYILRVLEAKNWRIGGENGAASTLGMHVNTLRGRMKKLGIKRPKPHS